MTCGIYCITNKLNGKRYIGQSINIEKRWREHKYRKDNAYIHNAMQKYGIESFDFEILCECEEDKLDSEEIKFINLYSTYNQGYNLTKGGKRREGFNHSEESKKKMSEAKKGIPLSEEHKQKVSESLKGRKVPTETRKKISESNKGKKISEETRKKISEARKGRKHSEETKKKISDSLKGVKSPMYGKNLSEETKQKIGDANTKQYARVVKDGVKKGRQSYAIRKDKKRIKTSIFVNKLVKWFEDNYPNEELRLGGINIEI